MESNPERLPSLLSRWLGSLTDLFGAGAGASLRTVPPHKRLEIIKERLAENHELRDMALRQRQTLLNQLQKAREIETDLRSGNGEPLPEEPDLPDSLTDLTPIQINEVPDSANDDDSLEQDMSLDQDSEILDIDEDGDRLIVENERMQLRQRDSQGRERFVTQISSRVYDGSALVGKSDYLAKLSLEPGNIVKVRFSDGSSQDAVFTGKYAKESSKGSSSSGSSSSGGSSAGSYKPSSKPSSHSSSSSSKSGGPRPIVAFPGSPQFAVSATSITANVSKKISSRTRDKERHAADREKRMAEEQARFGEEATDFRTTTGPI